MLAILQAVVFFVVAIFAAAACLIVWGVTAILIFAFIYGSYQYLYHKLERAICIAVVKSQYAVRCTFVVPPLMGELGVQFGAWDWCVVSKTLFQTGSDQITHEWVGDESSTWKKPRTRHWKRGHGKGKGKNGQGTSSNSSGRFGGIK